MVVDEKILATACLAAVLLKRRRRRRNKPKKRLWVRGWIKNRESLGVMNNLLQELREGDEAFYKNFLRMAAVDFEYLLEKLTPLIKKQDTLMRKAITPAERLAITLRYLATGDSYRSLMYLFRVPTNTISLIIPEVCQAIFDILKDEYLKTPNTEDEWTKIASDFDEKWNFPNCLGAIDGKHINIKAPANAGSSYFNYKHMHSIILLGLGDANYRFIYINVGALGRESDGGVYNNSALSNALENNTLNIPSAKPLPGKTTPVPFVIVADDAFALKPYMMKPFANKCQSIPQRIYNYRLSRARRIIENIFGILSARFRVLRRPIELPANKVKQIVCAVVVLHNFLLCRNASKSVYAPRGTFDVENEDGSITHGSWRQNDCIKLESLRQRGVVRNASILAKNVREEFKDYFCREGEVSWQCNYI